MPVHHYHTARQSRTRHMVPYWIKEQTNNQRQQQPQTNQNTKCVCVRVYKANVKNAAKARQRQRSVRACRWQM